MVGGSGTGKSVLMRSIIGLQRPDEGEITVFGEPMIGRDEEEAKHVRRRWGVLFQGGALFSGLTVAENIQVPIKEFYPGLDQELLDEISVYKTAMSGLAGRCRRQISLRALGRHEQARRASPARSRSIPSSCSSTSRPRGSIRSAPPRFDQLILGAAPRARSHRLPDHARSRHALRDLRPGRGARRQEGGGGRNDSGIIGFGSRMDPGIFQGAAGSRGGQHR